MWLSGPNAGVARVVLCLFLSTMAVASPPVTFDPGGMTSMPLRSLKDRKTLPDDVAVAVWPTSLLDATQTHWLSQDTPTICIIALANPRAISITKAWLIIELPVSVQIIGANGYLPDHLVKRESFKRNGIDYVRWIYPCSTHETTLPRGRQASTIYSRYRAPAVWLHTAAKAGSELPPLSVRLRYLPKHSSLSEVDQLLGEDPEQLTEPAVVKLKVAPKPIGTQPQIADSGVMGRFIFNGTAKLGQILQAYHHQLGYSLYINGPAVIEPDPRIKRWREAPVQNAYTLHIAEKIPDDQQFVQRDGTVPKKTVTPSALYEPTSWVRQHFLNRVDELLQGETFRDGVSPPNEVLLSNWEPYGFASGCRSERNFDAFVAWSKLDPATVRQAWPAKVDKQFAQQWKAFNKWQIGQTMGELARYVDDARKRLGRQARFGIWASNDAFYAPDHAMELLVWGDLPIDMMTWQYYFVPTEQGVFPPSDRMCAVQVVRSAAMRRFTDKKIPGRKHLRIGCIYGWDQTSGRSGFFLPEQLAFLHMSTVLAGAQITHNYAEYPIWDGRYAAAIAHANDRIARWETYTLTGKQINQHVVVPRSPSYPQQVDENVTPADQQPGGEWLHPDYLFSYGYQLDDKRLIAVANTWDNGECFFQLRIFDLDDHKRYRLVEPEAKRIFTDGDGNTEMTGKQLREEGLLLHVGATRWGCFLLEPADAPKADDYTQVSPAVVRHAMQQRKTKAP